jgi:hypothetical protein
VAHKKAKRLSFSIIPCDRTVIASGIPSEETFGTPFLVYNQIVTASGIPSAEAFGNPIVLLAKTVSPVGIVSEEVFGNPSINLSLVVSGIASEEAFGEAKVLAHQVIRARGIVSEEAFGTPFLVYNQIVGAQGIASEEMFGGHLVKGPRVVQPFHRRMPFAAGLRFGLTKLKEKAALSVGLKSVFGMTPLVPADEEVAPAVCFNPEVLNIIFDDWTWLEVEYTVLQPLTLMSVTASSPLLGPITMESAPDYIFGKSSVYSLGFSVYLDFYTDNVFKMNANEKGYIGIYIECPMRLALWMQNSDVNDVITINLKFKNGNEVIYFPVTVDMENFIPEPPYVSDPDSLSFTLIPHNAVNQLLSVSGPLKLAGDILAHSACLGDFTLPLITDNEGVAIEFGSEASCTTPEYGYDHSDYDYGGYCWFIMVRQTSCGKTWEVYITWSGNIFTEAIEDTITFTIDFIDPFGNHVFVPVTAEVDGNACACTITASVGDGAAGSISPSGDVSVSYGASKTFTFTPADGCIIDDILVDGKSIVDGEALPEYTFTNVTKDHTIQVIFLVEEVWQITGARFWSESIRLDEPIYYNNGYAGYALGITVSFEGGLIEMLFDISGGEPIVHALRRTGFDGYYGQCDVFLQKGPESKEFRYEFWGDGA